MMLQNILIRRVSVRVRRYALAVRAKVRHFEHEAMESLPMSAEYPQHWADRGWHGTATSRGMSAAGGQLAVLFLASCGLGWLALVLAPAVQPDSEPFDTRFVHPVLWGATLVFAVPLWFFARRWTSFLLCLTAVVLVAAPHFGVFAVDMNRVSQSGLAQGLEVFSIMMPFLFGVIFSLAVLVGRHEGLSRPEHEPGHGNVVRR